MKETAIIYRVIGVGGWTNYKTEYVEACVLAGQMGARVQEQVIGDHCYEWRTLQDYGAEK